MKKFDPVHAAENDYTREDCEDVNSPEATDEELATARSFAEAFPDLAEGIKRRRGRPRLEKPKEQVTLRLDADVIAKFRATGPGWMARMNDVLKQAKV